MSIRDTSSAIDGEIESVLVATDFSAASVKPLHHAAAVARHFGAKLYLMHVVSSLGFTLAGPEATQMATDLAYRDVREVEKDLMARGELTGIRHEAIVCHGDIWDEVKGMLLQKGIDLMVIGTHGRTGLAKIATGSVAEKIFRHACCKVLTVGPNSPTRAQLVTGGVSRPILFPTDFGEGSIDALPYAISIARRRSARLVLLHMLPPVGLPRGDRWYTPHDIVLSQKEAQSTARRRLQELIGGAVSSAVDAVPIVEFGDPSEGILRISNVLNVEAIILGLNHGGHSLLRSRFCWSTAYDVVCRARCPVLTVRQQSAAAESGGFKLRRKVGLLNLSFGAGIGVGAPVDIAVGS